MDSLGQVKPVLVRRWSQEMTERRKALSVEEMWCGRLGNMHTPSLWASGNAIGYLARCSNLQTCDRVTGTTRGLCESPTAPLSPFPDTQRFGFDAQRRHYSIYPVLCRICKMVYKKPSPLNAVPYRADCRASDRLDAKTSPKVVPPVLLDHPGMGA